MASSIYKLNVQLEASNIAKKIGLDLKKIPDGEYRQVWLKLCSVAQIVVNQRGE